MRLYRICNSVFEASEHFAVTAANAHFYDLEVTAQVARFRIFLVHKTKRHKVPHWNSTTEGTKETQIFCALDFSQGLAALTNAVRVQAAQQLMLQRLNLSQSEKLLHLPSRCES